MSVWEMYYDNNRLRWVLSVDNGGVVYGMSTPFACLGPNTFDVVLVNNEGPDVPPFVTVRAYSPCPCQHPCGAWWGWTETLILTWHSGDSSCWINGYSIELNIISLTVGTASVWFAVSPQFFHDGTPYRFAFAVSISCLNLAGRTQIKPSFTVSNGGGSEEFYDYNIDLPGPTPFSITTPVGSFTSILSAVPCNDKMMHYTITTKPGSPVVDPTPFLKNIGV